MERQLGTIATDRGGDIQIGTFISDGGALVRAAPGAPSENQRCPHELGEYGRKWAVAIKVVKSLHH